MQHYLNTWQFWALMAAFFAALTAIFAKVGVEGVNSNFATFLRTVVVVAALGALLWFTGQYESLANLSGRTMLFLVLSGLATGASWLCYFRALQIGKAAQVAPIDKLSVVLVAVFAALFLGERLSATGWTGVVLIGAGAILVAVG
ncbi:EamA family transporter [Oricola thermophila]|uniref:EamA family transporter n=1 Tax=Oricola thermophila TaxID=2742145 RepID=A0A6N1VAJ1_9HYPH|nr:EamA family transporter [Oricola thermophila]QKV18021.1 EamA family transporter [Oricola thermophila]